MTISRRSFAEAAFATAFLSLLSEKAKAEAEAPAPVMPDHDMSGMPASWMGKEKVAFVIYPGLAAMDFIGPHCRIGNLMGATNYIVAKTKDPVLSDTKVSFNPSTTFAECPEDIDILCVPGGDAGTLAAMEDAETIAFIKDRGSRAKYVTSVCTGAFILARAGLLEGYKATTHWSVRNLLADFGAEPVDQRIVFDRNRVTAAGVTAGIDMGLSLVAKLRDQTYAESLQLIAEYAPEPPFNAGSPHTAPKAEVDMMMAMIAPFASKAKELAKQSR
ncbi:DJ-1/PfpI family protein [Hyphomicrobium sp.]|uniref:DJ-1/PfpI family protein n=1 Tax=Hyphomicrobium sp. TaxID=82 RepID=UPI000F9C3888|nr:DJ-1/PfpI family protein [Hyphomicrobium sp.]RUO97758.1 MAG: DJ-1/PfpI family protein [Hyphomicrobium sp.]